MKASPRVNQGFKCLRIPTQLSPVSETSFVAKS
jgi:hypothetical protein